MENRPEFIDQLTKVHLIRAIPRPKRWEPNIVKRVVARDTHLAKHIVEQLIDHHTA
jgi:hypothetical protein